MRIFAQICCLLVALLVMSGCRPPDQTQVERLEKLRQIFKQQEKNDTVYKTGMMAEKGNSMIPFSVSPDGKRILFSTGNRVDGVILFDLATGRKSKLPEPENTDWMVPEWSNDGKQLVTMATPINDGHYQLDAMEVILLNPNDWSYRVLAASPGVNGASFFSLDQKTIYYFKGKLREPGRKTLANKFDLYAYNLNTNQETRLTNGEVMFLVRLGYDYGQSIYLSAIASPDSPWAATHGVREDIYVFNKISSDLAPLDLDRSNGFLELTFAGKSKHGDIYFTASKKNPTGGNYLHFVYRCDRAGQNCAILREVTNSTNRLLKKYHLRSLYKIQTISNCHDLYVVVPPW
jgi:dipeptidyl aminopeptidase/acylaminoacyl peptidase